MGKTDSLQALGLFPSLKFAYLANRGAGRIIDLGAAPLGMVCPRGSRRTLPTSDPSASCPSE